MEDPDQITRILFKKHGDYLSYDKVSYCQVRNLVVKILEYLQSLAQEEEEEEGNMNGQMENGEFELPEEMTPVSF